MRGCSLLLRERLSSLSRFQLLVILMEQRHVLLQDLKLLTLLILLGVKALSKLFLVCTILLELACKSRVIFVVSQIQVIGRLWHTTLTLATNAVTPGSIVSETIAPSFVVIVLRCFLWDLLLSSRLAQLAILQVVESCLCFVLVET